MMLAVISMVRCKSLKFWKSIFTMGIPAVRVSSTCLLLDESIMSGLGAVFLPCSHRYP